MAVVNKPVGPRLPLANVSLNATNNASSNTQANIDALKRKFQRVNQEIVKQNVMLQENLARTRQEHHSVLQENVRLKGRIVALESKLHEAEGVCIDTKKAIGDRIEILEAIGGHFIQVTKFLRILSTENEQDERQTTILNSDGKIVDIMPNANGKRSGNPRRPSMHSIPEEDVRDLTDHISDVSLNEPEKAEAENKLYKQHQKQDEADSNDEFSMQFLNTAKLRRPGHIEMKRPVSFFFVEYDHLDPFGYLLAFLSFTPPFLVAIQTAVYLVLLLAAKTPKNRNLQQSSLLAGKLLLGQLLNEILNLALKNAFRQPRPSTISNYSDYGMPSSHSQFMGFLLAIFPSLAAQVCKSVKVPKLFTAAIISASYLGTILIAYGRIYLGYHSIDQVLVGLGIGYIVGILWYQRYMH